MSAEEEESIRDKPFDYSLSRFYDALPPSEDPNAESSVYSQVRQLQERYEFLESVGTGGTKQIDRVLDHRTNTEVAMARPREDLGERAYETFLTEARLTARLKHPNIITVHDVSIDDQKCPFFTMELKVGDSLSTILKKLSQDDVDYSLRYNRDTLLGMFVRLCDAVAYAHSQKVLHLDLKPANVQVGQFGGVQLCDWGLARVMGVADDDAGDGMIKGTPGYMAPEQVQADAKSVQTDIYALGGILYAILTYQAPHRGTEEDILQSTVKGTLVPPAQAYPDRTIPESLNAVAVKAMAVNPEERYQGVEELQREVRRYLGGYATRAENAGVRRLLQLLYRRNRTLCWSIGTAVAVIVIGTGLFIDQLRLSEGRALEQKAIAELAQRKAEENFILYKEQTKESLKLAEDIRTSTVNMMDVENFMGA
ncbi:MAG: serine/threonine protein kinase, partial [Coraliomargarita sp.]|nr:serine/threonine protein kinase [Coraliomargarita sp.]